MKGVKNLSKFKRAFLFLHYPCLFIHVKINTVGQINQELNLILLKRSQRTMPQLTEIFKECFVPY